MHVAVPFVGAGHAVHELVPQLLTLVFETHIPAHKCCPIGHWHAPATHVCPPVQRRLHIPQLLLSVCVSTHAGSQNVCPIVGQRHALPVHVCAIGHALLHIPQCIALEVKSTHAAPHMVSAPQSTAHAPERQT